MRVGKIALAAVGVLFFMSLSIAPLMSAFQSQSAGSGGLSPELVQQEIEGYQSVLEREPDNRVALTGLVDLSLQSGNFETAIAPLEKLIELEPEDDSLGLLLARVKNEMGDTAGSIAVYEQLLEANPESLQIQDELLAVRMRGGDSAGAIAMLQERLEADPTSRSIRRDLATNYIQANRPEEALEILDELIEEDPSDYSPILGKAMALSITAMNDPDGEGIQSEAQDLFAQAARLAPPQQREQVQQISQFYEQLATINADNEVQISAEDDAEPEETESEETENPDQTESSDADSPETESSGTDSTDSPEGEEP